MASEDNIGPAPNDEERGAEDHAGGAGEHPSANKKVNYYEVLGVDQDADDQTIRKVYKKMALKLHPDKNRDDPTAQERFALLSEAFQVLTDPVKRIDHNKELEGGVVGWGYDRKAATERAKNYQWNGASMFFNRGEAMEESRVGGKYGYVWPALRQALMFWGQTLALMAVCETLVVVTALQLGALQAAAVWGSILGGLLLMGAIVWVSTDDWEYPVGALVVVVCVVSLLAGLLAGDCLLQGAGQGDELDPAGLAVTHLGGYEWRGEVVVDWRRVVRGEGGVCAAPIVGAGAAGGNYSGESVGYWAVAEGCCDDDQEPRCEGWTAGWARGINWWMPDRPSTLFLQGSGSTLAGPAAGLSPDSVYEAIASVRGGEAVLGPVPVVWSQHSAHDIAHGLRLAGLLCAVLLPLCWPLVFSLLWITLTLGTCCLKPRMHCNRPLLTWCFYVCSGCPGCWSELELIDE